MGDIILVTGGAKSGKSSFACTLASKVAAGGPVAYMATAKVVDEETARRVREHRLSRPDHWKTFEVPTQLHLTIRSLDARFKCAILDCLGNLVFNILSQFDWGDDQIDASHEKKATSDLLEELRHDIKAMKSSNATFVVVTNEVGMGLVPPTPLGRAYRDLLGRANQMVMAQAKDAYLMVSGIPIKIK